MENKTILNERELLAAQSLQAASKHVWNALGYEVDITTLTTIIKRVSEQKFFTIAPADYVPIRVGEGAWSSNLVTYRSYYLADDFATGIINLAGNNSRLAAADAGVDAVTVPVVNWAKTISWSLFDLQMAAKSGNWDIVVSKEKARKKNWDLGIQRAAFLGIDSNVLGLLTQTDVTANTTLITEPISGMTAEELSALLKDILGVYRANAKYTVFPTHFIIPERDYTGLAAPSSASFPLKSKLELLESTFKTITMNPNFKILPCAYADQVNNGLGKNRYVLLNYDEESVRMDIPVDYTSTLANSINNFQFQNVGYGQFTGVKAYRPLEMIYFDYSE